MVEIPNIFEGLVSGFCDFVTKKTFAGTGRAWNLLEQVWLVYVCGLNYLYEQAYNVQFFIFKRFFSGIGTVRVFKM